MARKLVFMLAALWLAAAGSVANAQAAGPVRNAARREAIEALMEKLRPLALPAPTPGPYDWLTAHPEEPGQTFKEYLACTPMMVTAERSILYVQPLGTFTASQRKIVATAAEFLGLYYNVRVKIEEDVPFGEMPEAATRKSPTAADEEQIRTGYILDLVLKPRLPKDAAAMIGFTTTDLWPGGKWNYVFGMSRLRERVGVWSIKRLGDPDGDEAARRLCLKRTIHLAAHETGHMFSMLHCRKYSCCMCGCNNLPESDKQPLEVCPECVAKIWWATGADPAGRYRKLEEFCRREGLKEEAEWYGKCLKAIETSAAESGTAAKKN